MIHRKILRQCGGDLKHAVKVRATEQSLAKDIIHISAEVATRTRIGSSRMNIKTRFNTPWKDSVEKSPKENSSNMKYKSSEIIRKFHILQSTTYLANAFPKRGKINEIIVENEHDIEKDDVNEDNLDDRLFIFSEYSEDIENIKVTFDIMESYSHLPQLSNSQPYLSKIQDVKRMKTKTNRRKGYTAGNFCITEVVIENKPTKLLFDPGDFCYFFGNFFLRNCVPNLEDQLIPIDGIRLKSASNPTKELGIFETT
ncbi:hypothetical protein O181_043198 [Austropuccinia psidii MF-1]|uniref:Uncharacterized protein n=1 Tax=Austropuccinia psidii MF-1 TaxID=1389203 RepID=A0A9Q3HFG2_9BASI|nr:hypothetical protein [Austropuccinia psidii MF-1]